MELLWSLNTLEYCKKWKLALCLTSAKIVLSCDNDLTMVVSTVFFKWALSNQKRLFAANQKLVLALLSDFPSLLNHSQSTLNQNHCNPCLSFSHFLIPCLVPVHLFTTLFTRHFDQEFRFKLTGKWDRQEWTGNKLQRKSNEKKSKKLSYICNNKITITSSYVCWLLHTVTFAVVPLNVTLSSQEWCQTLQRTTEKKTDSCTLWCVLIFPAQSEGKSPLENDRFPMNAQISQKTKWYYEPVNL